jgi:GPH family glycoside/pentoside/hexuronide:cation symporter
MAAAIPALCQEVSSKAASSDVAGEYMKYSFDAPLQAAKAEESAPLVKMPSKENPMDSAPPPSEGQSAGLVTKPSKEFPLDSSPSPPEGQPAALVKKPLKENPMDSVPSPPGVQPAPLMIGTESAPPPTPQANTSPPPANPQSQQPPAPGSTSAEAAASRKGSKSAEAAASSPPLDPEPMAPATSGNSGHATLQLSCYLHRQISPAGSDAPPSVNSKTKSAGHSAPSPKSAGKVEPCEEHSIASVHDPVPLCTKLLLCLGESVQGVWITIAGFYLNTYFLEICCLDPVAVSAIQLVQGLFDAGNDPLIGYLSDHTRTRWGRRRPWFLFGGPVLAVSYFGLWNKIPAGAGNFRFFYYLFCYAGVSVGVSCIQLQIAALTPELTEDYDERTAISAYRLVSVIVSGLAGSLLHGFIVSSSEDRSVGYRISGAVFAIGILVASWTVFCGIREKFSPLQESGEKMGFWQELKTLVGNKAFFCVIMIYLCGPTAVALVQTNMYMFCKYVMKDEDAMSFLIMAVGAFAIIATPLWVLVGQRFGKRSIYFAGGPLLAIAMSAISLVQNVYVGLIVSAAIGSCLGIVYLVPYSLLPDVIEDDEIRTGKRREGIFSGFFTVSLKLTVTFALTLTNLTLKVTGYQSPKLTCSDVGAATSSLSIGSDQPQAVIRSIQLLVGPIPAVLIMMAVGFAWAFPITRESHAALLEQVKSNRKASKLRNSIEHSGNSEADSKATIAWA